MKPTFVDRLKAVMGDEPPTPWARARGISPATIHEWLTKTGVTPYPKTLDRLQGRTGIPKAWWLDGELPPPEPLYDLLIQGPDGHTYIEAKPTVEGPVDLASPQLKGLMTPALGQGKTQLAGRVNRVATEVPSSDIDPLLLERVVSLMLEYLEENKDRVRIDIKRQAALIAVLYRWAAKSGGISDEEFAQLMRAAA